MSRFQMLRMTICNKILILVIFIMISLTTVVSVVVGLTTNKKYTSVTIRNLKRLSTVFENRIRLMYDRMLVLTQSFQDNEPIRNNVKTMCQMGPYYALEESLLKEPLEESEKSYFFQAQLNLVRLLRSHLEVNNLSSISVYLSPTFVANEGPSKSVLSLRISREEIVTPMFVQKGDVSKKVLYRIKTGDYSLPPSDYFDITSIYSNSAEHFYRENKFLPTEKVEAFYLESKEPLLPQLALKLHNGKPILECSYPFYAVISNPATFSEEKAKIGTIKVEAAITADLLNELKEEMGVDVGISRNNELLVSTFKDILNTEFKLDNDQIDLGDFSYYCAATPYRGTETEADYMALTFSPTDKLEQFTKVLFMQIFAVAIVTIIIASVVTYFVISLLIKKPLTLLTTGVQRISEGDLSYTVAVDSNDELGILAHSFNHMSEALQKKTDVLVSTVNDLDRAKNSVKNIFNSMPSTLIGLDANIRITHWNLHAESFTGIKSDQAIGQMLVDVLPKFEIMLSMVRKSLNDREVLTQNKVQHEIEGNLKYFDLTYYPLVDQELQGIVVRIDDITERVQIETIMVQTEKMMSVGGLAAGMAHEINNPLGGIMQGTQNIVRRTATDLPANNKAAKELGTDIETIQAYMKKRRVFDFLEGIKESANRAAHIVRDMLQFSRQSEDNVVVVDLHSLLDRTIMLAENDYDSKKNYDFKHITIVREYDPRLHEVPCIKMELEQVILNLLKNSAYAMNECKTKGYAPKLTIRLIAEDEYARIEVGDNGTGIPQDVLSHIFDPFYTTKPVGIGTGLGLSVSYSIITQNHHGYMSVKSEVGTGTTFIIKIPRAHTQAETKF